MIARLYPFFCQVFWLSPKGISILYNYCILNKNEILRPEFIKTHLSINYFLDN